MTNEATRIMSDAEMDAAEALAEARLAEARERPTDPELERRVEELLARPYRLEVRGNPTEGYLARAPELPGCITAGETPEQALALLHGAMAGWLEAALLAGDPIPEPDHLAEDRHGGRMLIRMPKSLHRAIAEAAEREGVSANQYAVMLLAAGVSQANVVDRPSSATPWSHFRERLRLRYGGDQHVEAAVPGLWEPVYVDAAAVNVAIQRILEALGHTSISTAGDKEGGDPRSARATAPSRRVDRTRP
jgi:antitoxin HicB